MLPIVDELTGTSAAISTLRQDVETAARSDAKVLITGESGTGKEITARLIHARGRRRAMPLIPINCAGIPETLLESELFGHERGSFTGAVRQRGGLLESADGGTAFLDEVGEMTLRMQGLLLRFLETGEIQRVGSDRQNTRVDVRIVAATNRDLYDLVQTNDFRLDLYYRLNVVHLRTPALRERREDIPSLLHRFLDSYSRKYEVDVPQIPPDSLATLLAYEWPGNVRELKNVAERLVVCSRGGAVTARELASALQRPREAAPAAASLVTASGASGEADQATKLYRRMLAGESFWLAVYEPFMARDLTRDDMRAVVRKGLEETRGSYKLLVRLFNMTDADYKRVLNFLRKYDCKVAFQEYRRMPASLRLADPLVLSA